MQPRRTSALKTYVQLEALSNDELKLHAVELHFDICSVQEDPEMRKDSFGHSHAAIARLRNLRHLVGILYEREDELDEDTLLYVVNPEFGVGPAGKVAELFEKYFLSRGCQPGQVSASITLVDEDGENIATGSLASDPVSRAAQLAAFNARIELANPLNLRSLDPESD